jgi:hypothetical protein
MSEDRIVCDGDDGCGALVKAGRWAMHQDWHQRVTEPAVLITSAHTVKPGDKILLVLPDQVTQHEGDQLKKRLEEWAPDADWLLIGGVEVYQRSGEAT